MARGGFKIDEKRRKLNEMPAMRAILLERVGGEQNIYSEISLTTKFGEFIVDKRDDNYRIFRDGEQIVSTADFLICYDRWKDICDGSN